MNEYIVNLAYLPLTIHWCVIVPTFLLVKMSRTTRACKMSWVAWLLLTCSCTVDILAARCARKLGLPPCLLRGTEYRSVRMMNGLCNIVLKPEHPSRRLFKHLMRRRRPTAWPKAVLPPSRDYTPHRRVSARLLCVASFRDCMLLLARTERYTGMPRSLPCHGIFV